MTPLFACFPVCMMFVALGILAVAILILDVVNRVPRDDRPANAIAPRDPKQVMGPPPWWVLPVMMLVLTLVMLVLAWYWPE